MTKLMVSRYETDSAGKKRAYPWSVQIQNGIGIKGKNSNGGHTVKRIVLFRMELQKSF